MSSALDIRNLRISEAARELGLHPNSLRRAERAGRIPAARREPVSQERYYTPEDLDEIRRRLFGRW